MSRPVCWLTNGFGEQLPESFGDGIILREPWIVKNRTGESERGPLCEASQVRVDAHRMRASRALDSCRQDNENAGSNSCQKAGVI
jgi:hypothetical protein